MEEPLYQPPRWRWKFAHYVFIACAAAFVALLNWNTIRDFRTCGAPACDRSECREFAHGPGGRPTKLDAIMKFLTGPEDCD